MVVRKSDGSYEEFDRKKLSNIVKKTFKSAGITCDEDCVKEIVDSLYIYDGIMCSSIRKQLQVRFSERNEELLIAYLLDLGIGIKSIVITQYDNFGEETLETIDNRLKVDCSESYIGAVRYNSSEDGWKYELNKYIDNVIYSHH